MSTVVVGCDENQGNDSEVQNTICKAIEKQGHTVEKLDIKPGPFGAYDWGENGKNPKGKIGVYIIADGLTSIADHYDNPGGFKYVYFVIRGDLGRPKMDSRKDFENNPIGTDVHGDCTSKSCGTLAGKPYPKINEIIKSKCIAVFGTTAKEMADELIKAMGGETSSSDSGSTSSSSIKEAIKDVLWNWDGEAECYIRNDTVHVRKIPSPTDAKLTLAEGDNIDMGSINITDYNPTAVNHVKTTFQKYELTIQDDHLVKRFGQIPQNIEMDSSVKTLEGAKKHLQREWNKLKRENGHSLELKTYGHSKWKQGEWCRVYLPSYNLDDYMYITKVSQDDSGTWDCSLTLVDYPPSFGEPSKTETKEEEETDTENTENNEGSETEGTETTEGSESS